MIELSVIIVSRNVSPLLDRCLISVKKQELWARRSMEILVVDNASHDGSLAMVKRKHPQVRLIANAENRGFAAAANQGLTLARGKFLAVLNSDTEVSAGAFDILVDYARRNPHAGIIGPQVLGLDGSIQPTRRDLPNFTNILFARKSPLHRFLPSHPLARRYLMADGDPGQIQQVPALAGVCLLLSRVLWDRIGGFDEGFFMYLEDIDLCLRAWQAGWTVDYVPQARVRHWWGASACQERRAMEQRHRRSLYRYFLKHHQPNTFQRLYLYLALTVHWLLGG